MGTRRSRHNKGRKPIYKDHGIVASHILSRQPYGGMWLNSRLNWQPIDLMKLDVLCEADAGAEQSADALGRGPTNLAHKARELGYTLPPEWARLIAPKRAKRPAVSRHELLAYPYIAKPTDAHADIMAVNALVPAGMPEHVRADVCQEIMIAIMEGRTTLEMLKAKRGSASYFIRKFYKDNYEQAGHAISFDAVSDEGMSTGESVERRVASRDYTHEVLADRHRSMTPMRLFTAPTQFEAAWRDQVGRFRLSAHQLGHFMSQEEAEELLEAAE